MCYTECMGQCKIVVRYWLGIYIMGLSRHEITTIQVHVHGRWSYIFIYILSQNSGGKEDEVIGIATANMDAS